MSTRGRCLDWGPWLAAGAFGVLLALPATRSFALGIQEENRLIEWATVALLAVAVSAAAHAALRPGTARERGLCAAAALAFIFVLGEEIAWGQYLLGGPISSSWADANRQGETTLHNLDLLQGKSELWYLLPALAALFATRAPLAGTLGRAAVSPRQIPALILVVLHALAELSSTWWPQRPPLDNLAAGLRPMGELIELVIAWIACRWALGARRAS